MIIDEPHPVIALISAIVFCSRSSIRTTAWSSGLSCASSLSTSSRAASARPGVSSALPLTTQNTAAAPALTFGFAGLCALVLWWGRRADPWRQTAFLCYASILWTYHERYDFILMLLPLALQLGRDRHRLAPPAQAASLLAYALLGLALTDWAYLHDTPLTHAIRWAGRLALYGLTLQHAWALRPERPLSPAPR